MASSRRLVAILAAGYRRVFAEIERSAGRRLGSIPPASVPNREDLNTPTAPPVRDNVIPDDQQARAEE